MLHISITSSLQWSARDGYGQYERTACTREYTSSHTATHTCSDSERACICMDSLCLFARSFAHSFLREFLFVSAVFIFLLSFSSSSFYFSLANTICCFFACCCVRSHTKCLCVLSIGYGCANDSIRCLLYLLCLPFVANANTNVNVCVHVSSCVNEWI